MIIPEEERISAALHYAARGWRVFPVHGIRDGRCTCRKPEECESQGKHPCERNWLARATTGPNRIRQWWSQYPDGNIGLLTGAAAGIIVVDVDGDAGRRSWGQLGLDWDLDTLRASTGRGRHFYFQPPSDPVKTRAGVLNGIDVRAERGYIVAPPSDHASGRAYQFLNDGAAIRPVPAALLPVLAGDAPAQNTGPVRGRDDDSDGYLIPEGRRDRKLYEIGCAMRGRGMEKEQILEELMKVNIEKCEVPLNMAQVLKLAASAARWPKGNRMPGNAGMARRNG